MPVADELAQVEFAASKKFTRIPTPASLENTLHYTLVITTKKQIEENREGLIRFLEGWILTQDMMSSKDAASKLTFASLVYVMCLTAFASGCACA